MSGANDELEYHLAETIDRLSAAARLIYGRPLAPRQTLRTFPWCHAPRRLSKKVDPERRPRGAPCVVSSGSNEEPPSKEELVLTLDVSRAAAMCERALRRAEKAIVKLELELQRVPSEDSSVRKAAVLWDVLDFSMSMVTMAGHVAAAAVVDVNAPEAKRRKEDISALLWRYRSDDEWRLASMNWHTAYSEIAAVVGDQADHFFTLLESFVTEPNSRAAREKETTPPELRKHLELLRTNELVHRSAIAYIDELLDHIRAPSKDQVISTPPSIEEPSPASAAGISSSSQDEDLHSIKTSTVAHSEPLVYEPSMTGHDVADALSAFYAAHNPDKLSDVPHIVTAFEGRYSRLFEVLNHKYLNLATDHSSDDGPSSTLILPLTYHDGISYDETVTMVEKFYEQVCPSKAVLASAVVSRHHDDIAKLFHLLNSKYLAGFDDSVSLQRLRFDCSDVAPESDTANSDTPEDPIPTTAHKGGPTTASWCSTM